MTDNPLLLCSFCAKHQRDVKLLICGPGVNICDECAMLCIDLVPVPIGCLTAGEAMAAYRAREDEAHRWASSPMIRDEHPLLIARIADLEAKVRELEEWKEEARQCAIEQGERD